MQHENGEVESFFEAVGLAIVLHIALVVIIIAAYMIFISRHWRALVVLTALVIWAMVAVNAAAFA